MVYVYFDSSPLFCLRHLHSNAYTHTLCSLVHAVGAPCTPHNAFHFVSICNQIFCLFEEEEYVRFLVQPFKRIRNEYTWKKIRTPEEKMPNRMSEWSINVIFCMCDSVHIKSMRVLIIEKCHSHKMKIQYSFAMCARHIQQHFSAVNTMCSNVDDVLPFPF